MTAGVAVPLLLHQQASQPALNQARHHHVTVHPAGPQSPAGLIASGTVTAGAGGSPRRSRARAVPGGARSASPRCSSSDCGPVTGASRSDPVAFWGPLAAPSTAEYGPVSAAVRYVTVRLADGTVLTLHPVTVYGTRLVAYGVPVHAVISRVTAYSAHGELASAIPFNDPDGTATVDLWLRPGQTGLPRATHLIGSGTAGGHAWSVTAYVGPWGECLVTRGGGNGSSGCARSFRRRAQR